MAAGTSSSVLSGANPVEYDPADTWRLFVIQAVIIIVFCRILHYPLSLMRQPRVIAEVIGGIILGPTVMGRIPGFLDTIFPASGSALLNLTSTIGLVLFLFVIGMEVDVRLVFKNFRAATSVAVVGMAVPMGLGFAISPALWNEFMPAEIREAQSFGNFLLFIGVALSITALPVLARILTELQMLHEPVGIVVLAAGVANDVTAWVLLALAVALVNANESIIVLYTLLCLVGYVLFLTFVIRPAFLYLCRRSKAFETGPSESLVCVTIIFVLSSAFFTDIIGVHAIFGGFVAGIVMPKQGGFSVKMTEKIEDLVSSLFLPLYFASSGLKTDLGLIRDGKSWGFTILIIAIAFLAKTLPSCLVSRMNGFLWRESLAVGTLMACKGLVELIVLNVGLSAGILSEKVFSMFVFDAVVVTFMTTPLTVLVYPESYRQRVARWRRGEIDWQGNVLQPSDTDTSVDALCGGGNRLVLALHSMVATFEGPENVPALMRALRLFSGTRDSSASSRMRIRGLRLMELSERTSDVMRVGAVNTLRRSDPTLEIFRTYAELEGLVATANIAVVPRSGYAQCAVDEADVSGADMILVPWAIEQNELADDEGSSSSGHAREGKRPADALLATMRHQEVPNAATAANAAPTRPRGVGQRALRLMGNMEQLEYVEAVFESASCAVAVVVDYEWKRAASDSDDSDDDGHCSSKHLASVTRKHANDSRRVDGGTKRLDGSTADRTSRATWRSSVGTADTGEWMDKWDPSEAHEPNMHVSPKALAACGPPAESGKNVLVLFLGGPDDRQAVALATLKMAERADMAITVLHVRTTATATSTNTAATAVADPALSSGSTAAEANGHDVPEPADAATADVSVLRKMGKPFTSVTERIREGLAIPGDTEPRARAASTPTPQREHVPALPDTEPRQSDAAAAAWAREDADAEFLRKVLALPSPSANGAVESGYGNVRLDTVVTDHVYASAEEAVSRVAQQARPFALVLGRRRRHHPEEPSAGGVDGSGLPSPVPATASLTELPHLIERRTSGVEPLPILARCIGEMAEHVCVSADFSRVAARGACQIIIVQAK